MPRLTLNISGKGITRDDFHMGYIETALFAELSPHSRAFARTLGSKRRDDWDIIYYNTDPEIYSGDIQFLRNEVRKYRISKGTLPPPLLRDPEEVKRELFEERRWQKKIKRYLKRKGLFFNDEGFLCGK